VVSSGSVLGSVKSGISFYSWDLAEQALARAPILAFCIILRDTKKNHKLYSFFACTLVVIGVLYYPI
jgi:hypothetical protein